MDVYILLAALAIATWGAIKCGVFDGGERKYPHPHMECQNCKTGPWHISQMELYDGAIICPECLGG